MGDSSWQIWIKVQWETNLIYQDAFILIGVMLGSGESTAKNADGSAMEC